VSLSLTISSLDGFVRHLRRSGYRVAGTYLSSPMFAEVFRVPVAVAVNQHRYLEGRTTATNTVGQLAVTHTAMAEAITAAAREAEEYPEHTGRRVLIVIDHSSWSIGSVPGNNAYLRALLKNLIVICST
jgi:hypothetical protein